MLRHAAASIVLLLAPLLFLPSDSLHGQVPRYTVVYPSQITSGEYSGDYDIFTMSFFGDGLLGGDPLKPKAVASQGFKELDPAMLRDGEGGYFLAYTVEHSDSTHKGDRDILMRRINHSGLDLWGDSTNHVLVIAQSKFVEQNVKIVELADRSLMVFYEVHYGPEENADVDIAAVRVARDGTMLWENGVWAANSKRRERLSSIVSDGNGGAFVVVEAISQRDSSHIGSDILAQHIDMNGMVGWKDSPEPVIVAGSRHIERNATVVSDGDGGAIVAYELEYVGSDRAGDIDILAQRVSRYGIRVWVDESHPPVVSSNAKARERAPVMVRDHYGVIVAFEVSFRPDRGKGMAHVIGMQRLDTAGRPVWNSGKKSNLIAPRADMAAERPQLLPDATGGAYLIFEGADSAAGDREVYVQRIDSEGEQIWGDGNRPIAVFNSPAADYNPSVALDDIGGLVVVASRRTTTEPVEGYNSIVAQRIAIDGTFPWAEYQSPLIIVNSAYMNGRAMMIRD